MICQDGGSSGAGGGGWCECEDGRCILRSADEDGVGRARELAKPRVSFLKCQGTDASPRHFRPYLYRRADSASTLSTLSV